MPWCGRRGGSHDPTLRIELHQPTRRVIEPSGVLEGCQGIAVGKIHKRVWIAEDAHAAKFPQEPRMRRVVKVKDVGTIAEPIVGVQNIVGRLCIVRMMSHHGHAYAQHRDEFPERRTGVDIENREKILAQAQRRAPAGGIGRFQRHRGRLRMLGFHRPYEKIAAGNCCRFRKQRKSKHQKQQAARHRLLHRLSSQIRRNAAGFS